MSPEETVLLRLRREIESEMETLHRLPTEIERSSSNSLDTLQIRGRASILHDFYTGVERVFVRIAEEIDGGVPRSEQWHRQLLAAMALDLPGVRPAVISEQVSDLLGEFLRFRHLFRNLYGFVLDDDRIRDLERKLRPALERFGQEISRFLDWLTARV